MAYWLMKSEPDAFSIEDLRKQQVAGWDGVRCCQKAFTRPLILEEIQSISELKNMVLLKNSRLSVQPVTAQQWKILLKHLA